ncbi:hypothetical protein PG995_002951 [Apiospora arundinis]
MSLPICLGAAHRASAFDVELPAFECQKYSEHKQAALDLFTPELDHGGSSIVNACAAWAILVASHENTTTLRISSPRISDGRASKDLHVSWNSHISDLVCAVQAILDTGLDSGDTVNIRANASSGGSPSTGSSRSLVFSTEEDLEASLATLSSLDGPDSSSQEDKEEYAQRFLISFGAAGSDICLGCRAQSGRVQAQVTRDDSNDMNLGSHLLSQYEYIVTKMFDPAYHESPLVDLKAISIPDLRQVWTWNASVPQGVDDLCIHDAFSQRARRHPERPALLAHDGTLTYCELEDRSSRLARVLIHRFGIKPGDMILVFIEKSFWVPVAQLAIMKCGGVSTILDASLPFQRQQSVAELVQPKAILTSPDYEKQAHTLGESCAHLTLDDRASRDWPHHEDVKLPKVDPSSWMYVVFTSGSTGTPKGAIISHANYASAVAMQQKTLDFQEADRVFDFASYAFDAAWCNLIHALSVGGCLCIPSDEERKDDLAAALRKYEVNYAVLTPSVAWFPASELPSSLRTIHFGGEPLKASLVQELSTKCNVINAYGPAECSTVSTASLANPKNHEDPSIGAGTGACTWLVKQDGSDLVPIGDVGELWIEGPIVGQGYLRDPEKTSFAFPDPPPWLLRGCAGGATDSANGRRGRLYRTGDLVRYQPDGDIEFVGRKDSQVKIRGQRVELGEIEYHLQHALTDESRERNVQVVAEVIKPEGSDVPTLVAFVFLLANTEVAQSDAEAVLHRATVGIENRLSETVPSYMIPSAFITVRQVPMTPTGKVDRRSLRTQGQKTYWQQLVAPTSEDEPSKSITAIQSKFREIWAQVLNLPAGTIGLDTPFMRLGGDSITAMQVVSRCRHRELAIRVSDVLRLQTIRLIAKSSKPLKEKRQLRTLEREDTDTSWPLTPIQHILFDNNPQGMNHYTLSYIVKLTRQIPREVMLPALLALTTRHSMLRARFRKRADGVWEQYIAPVGDETFELRYHHFVGEGSMQDAVDRRQASLDLVEGPVFAVDVFGASSAAQTVLMSAHHAVMDLVSWRITWCRLQRQEAEQVTDPLAVLPFAITPANFDYWGVNPSQMLFKDSSLMVSTVDVDATALLLGASNDCFRTEVLDILVGTLVYCFMRVFPDREPPPVFLEGHGREPIAGMDDYDVSEIVGWFTTVAPLELGGGPGSSILDMIKRAKDLRRSVPGKGRPYFASRFYSSAGRDAFAHHRHAEVIFNYRGSFQQLEDANSLFQLEDRQSRNLQIPGDGPDYLRPSLVDMNLVVQEGRLEVWTRYHRRMEKDAAIARWADVYAKGLTSVAHELAHLQPRHTVSDFPLLQGLSNTGLEKLATEELPRLGIPETDVIDMYPCTPMQEGILISSSIGAASYHTISVWQVVDPGGVKLSAARLAHAWETVSRAHPVCSTIFTTNPDTGRFLQIVLSRPNAATIEHGPENMTAAEFLSSCPSHIATPSEPQCFFSICVGGQGDIACRLDMHHALMDALSLPVITGDLERAYAGQDLDVRTPFRDCVEAIQATPGSQRLQYWASYLGGVERCDLPGSATPSPSRVSPTLKDDKQYCWLTLPRESTETIFEVCREANLTRSAFLHIAWSLVLSHFTGMRQVCFGYISSGRDLAIDGIEEIVGPLINMLIARVDLRQPLPSVVSDIATYNIRHLENEHVSLAELQHEMSVQQIFNTNITVREARSGKGAVAGGMHLVELSEEDPHEFDMVVAATLDKADTEVSIQYRTGFADAVHAQMILDSLRNAMEFLTRALPQQEFLKDDLFDAYFRSVAGVDEATALQSWQTQFRGIASIQWRDDCTISTQVLAAWALVQASTAGSGDALIGTNYGANAIPMPMRLQVNIEQGIESYLRRIESTVTACSGLAPLPISRLRHAGGDLALACDFQTVLGVDSQQPFDESKAFSVHFDVSDSATRLISRFDSQVVSMDRVESLYSQFETALRSICTLTDVSARLADVDIISSRDFQRITAWNGEHYEAPQLLVHHLISKSTERMPDALAVSAWDGELTYRELDRLSTKLAKEFVDLGVRPETVVAIYSEKSMWVPVSAVAVMKAGGASVLIDHGQPVERVRSIIEQVDAKIAVVSRATLNSCSSFPGLRFMVVDENLLNTLPESDGMSPLPQEVQPSNLVYISFTSGSTGKPKGAMITHSCFASSIRYQQQALGFRPGQRVYDFASYAFDASWSNLLHSFTSGSCLCIPSESQRIDALADSIRASRATLLNTTPSVLRHLDPNMLPDLEQILMGGEAWNEVDFLDWIDQKKLINAYGPGECTIKTCLNRARRGMTPNTLGVAVGLHTWIVRTDGSDRLAPLGSVGELWLEGPQVGRGYVGDESRTASSFITRPSWTEPGQTSRFYRTGDLVRYDGEGSLVFVSRKDTQVKIRGQRTELGEVEYNIKKTLLTKGIRVQVVADVFKPNQSDNPILVAFVKADDDGDDEPETWRRRLSGIDEMLANLVPDYMIPTAYIPLPQYPLTATGKIHRRSLRAQFEVSTLEKIVAKGALGFSSHVAPSTPTERLLQELWAEILGINPLKISATDSFFRIGGDSLGAMLLVGAARKQDLNLSVAAIFQQPRLCDLASFISGQDAAHQVTPQHTEIIPFSLLDAVALTPEECRNQAAALCNLQAVDIEDVFPCTPLQAGLIVDTTRRPGDNVLTETWAFQSGVEETRFRVAWQQVVHANPILRTRIVDLPGQGLVQVVVCPESSGIEKAMPARDLGLGTPLVSYQISPSSFWWSIHHALYDGWSMPLLFRSLTSHYHQSSPSIPDAPPFQAFLKSIQDCSAEKVERFWQAEFQGFRAPTFPVLPSRGYKARCDRRVKREIRQLSSEDDFTVATRIKLAWAVLLSKAAHSMDVSFGTTVSGRHADVAGIEHMTGPTIATVPLRVQVDSSKTVQDMLRQVQQQATDMMPFEQTGLQRIRQMSEDCQFGCLFQTLVVIQPEMKQNEGDSLFVGSSDADDSPFKVYAICTEFVLKGDSIYLTANYDSSLLSPLQFDRLLDRLESIMSQLFRAGMQAAPVHELETCSSSDLQQIWAWNADIPDESQETIHSIFGRVATANPEAPAVCAWDGDFTYRQVDDLSTRIAYKILETDLSENTRPIVPLFFEKSRWMSVCQIAVMKANAACLGIDVTLPDGRLQTIVDQVSPPIVLASAGQEDRARQLCAPSARIIVVGDACDFSHPLNHVPALPTVDPHAWLYVVFTSGSTGTPKGAIISHANFASALRHQQDFLQFRPQTRTYDFVSYAFDVSWFNAFFTLSAAGCLCVPSHHELQNDPMEALARYRANATTCTPTVAKLLRGSDLKVLGVGGEPLPRDEIAYWTERGVPIFHDYGPSECTPVAITHRLEPSRGRVMIGKGLGARTWVIEPESSESLAAIGDVGELWLEGPLVGQGYLDDPVKTAAAFVENPGWLLAGCPGFEGRCGRLYRTGDLVRYEEDGSLEFVGRKDSQVKIRGQRVELEEIEQHVLATVGSATASQILVEVVTPVDSTESMLVAFAKPAREMTVDGDAGPDFLRRIATLVSKRLPLLVPSYMVPNGFVVVKEIPRTTTGKTDRKELRNMAVKMRKEDLLFTGLTERRAPHTKEEETLHNIISGLLHRDGGSFGMDDNFIQLGGDSISAMRLVSMARAAGLLITVARVLGGDHIADLVSAEQDPLDYVSGIYPDPTSQFALLGDVGLEAQFVEQAVMPQIRGGPGRGQLIDILPVTDMQATYLHDNDHTPRRSWIYSYIDLPLAQLDEKRLVDSCDQLGALCDIYRTAFIKHQDSFLQVVFGSWKPIIENFANIDDIEAALDEIRNKENAVSLPLGVPLLQFKLIRGQSVTRLVLSMSHAIYDGISIGETFQMLANLYRHGPESVPQPISFRSYLLHTKGRDRAESHAYWSETLRGSTLTTVPCADPHAAGPPTIMERSVSVPLPPFGITPASLFTFACASAFRRVAATDDVVFGRVVAGRASVPTELQGAVGPCLNRVPVRLQFAPGGTRAELLASLQRQHIESLPHETVGLAEIVETCCVPACTPGTREFGCWVQYQNIEENPVVEFWPDDETMVKNQEAWHVPKSPDFLEIFAIQTDKDSLTVRLIGGAGYSEGLLADLLESVCSELQG